MRARGVGVGHLNERAQAVLVVGAVIAGSLLIPLSVMAELQTTQTHPVVEPMDVDAHDELLHETVTAAAVATDGTPASMDERIRADTAIVHEHHLSVGRVVRVAYDEHHAARLATHACPETTACGAHGGIIFSSDAAESRVIGVVFKTTVLGPDERGVLRTTVWVEQTG
jgi:hypothetical protein